MIKNNILKIKERLRNINSHIARNWKTKREKEQRLKQTYRCLYSKSSKSKNKHKKEEIKRDRKRIKKTKDRVKKQKQKR